MSELLPHFSTLTAMERRYISVALVRGFPLAGVTRYPCPVEPGLSSYISFRLISATAQFTAEIVTTSLLTVNVFVVKYFVLTIYDSENAK